MPSELQEHAEPGAEISVPDDLPEGYRFVDLGDRIELHAECEDSPGWLFGYALPEQDHWRVVFSEELGAQGTDPTRAAAVEHLLTAAHAFDCMRKLSRLAHALFYPGCDDCKEDED